MRQRRRGERGAAMLVIMSLSAALLLMVAGLLTFTQTSRTRAIQQSRTPSRFGCAESGLQLAKAYFSANFLSWNTYLKDPAAYNPVTASWMPGCAVKCSSIGPAKPLTCTPGDCTLNATLANAHPELFYDLDADGKPDVYIYVRDNQDELPPIAVDDPTSDNDQNVIVGAICISPTLVPRTADGRVDRERLQIEAILSYNAPDYTYGPGNQSNLNKPQ
jgi:hypothetical protein